MHVATLQQKSINLKYARTTVRYIVAKSIKRASSSNGGKVNAKRP